MKNFLYLQILFILFSSPLYSKNNTISNVTFHDPESLLEDFQKSILYSTVGTPFDDILLEGAEKTLEEYLKKRGFFVAEVKGEKNIFKSKISIVFRIVSGPQVILDKIKFFPITLNHAGLAKIFTQAFPKKKYPFYHPYRIFSIEPDAIYTKEGIARGMARLQTSLMSVV